MIRVAYTWMPEPDALQARLASTPITTGGSLRAGQPPPAERQERRGRHATLARGLTQGDGPRRARSVAGAGEAIALVGAFSVTVAVGIVGGVLLDDHFHTHPWLTVTGLLCGLAGGTIVLARGVRALGRS